MLVVVCIYPGSFLFTCLYMSSIILSTLIRPTAWEECELIEIFSCETTDKVDALTCVLGREFTCSEKDASTLSSHERRLPSIITLLKERHVPPQVPRERLTLSANISILATSRNHKS